MIYSFTPYVNNETEAYVTAVNIIAVEYLIKTSNPAEYERRICQLYSLTETDWNNIFGLLTYNMHTSSLGAMITQGDYEEQKVQLFTYLDDAKERRSEWKN